MAFDTKDHLSCSPSWVDVLLTYCLENFPSSLSLYVTLNLEFERKWWEHQQSQGSWLFRAAISAVYTQGIQTSELMTWEHGSARPEVQAKHPKLGSHLEHDFVWVWSILCCRNVLVKCSREILHTVISTQLGPFLLQVLIMLYKNSRNNG